MGRAEGEQAETIVTSRGAAARPAVVELQPFGDVEPTKILVAGDVHMDTQAIDFLARTAKQSGCEIILQVGDFGIWTHEEEGKRFLRKASRLLKSVGVILLFIDGNHEAFSKLWEGGQPKPGAFKEVSPGIFYIPRGSRWTWAGVNFLALGGAHSIDKDYRLHEERRKSKPRTAWWHEELITDADVDAALSGDGPVDVMVTHDAPWGMDIGLGSGYKDDMETTMNRRRITQVVDKVGPALLFHGHYHFRHSNPYYHMGTQLLVKVEGLNMNGTREQSCYVLDLGAFKAEHAQRFEDRD